MHPKGKTKNHEPDPQEIRQSLRRFIALIGRLCASELTRTRDARESSGIQTRATRRRSKVAK